MTVKELFKSVEFMAIADALQRTLSSDKSVRDIASYKESYDILCNTEFDGKGGKVTFSVYSDGVLADGVEGDLWSNIVGKEVVRPEGHSYTDAELAAWILWGATFYGFTPMKSWSRDHREIYNKYSEREHILYQRLNRPYIRDKRTRSTMKQRAKQATPRGLAMTLEDRELIRYRKAHQNRAKRKRYYRLEKRIEQLSKMSRRQDLIDRLVATTGVWRSAISNRIMKAKAISETYRESHTYGKIGRADYLVDLLSNYAEGIGDFCESRDEMIVVIYATESNPITDEEKFTLHKFLREESEKCNIRLHILPGVEDSIGDELALMFIVISQ